MKKNKKLVFISQKLKKKERSTIIIIITLYSY